MPALGLLLLNLEKQKGSFLTETEVLEARDKAVCIALPASVRNYLFVGHPDAGWRSAVIYSVVGTCRLLGVNPEAYLLWVLPRLAAATTKSATGLLPHDYLVLSRS